MRHRRLALLLVSALGALTVGVTLAGGSTAARAPGQTISTLSFVGTSTLSVHGTNSTVDATSVETSPAADVVDQAIPNSGNSAARVKAAGLPRVAGNGVADTGSELLNGFSGINHYDSRTAGTGDYANTNYSLEPPDQGMCVGNGYVLEAVNDAVRAYTTGGTAVTDPVALNQFFGLAPSIIRSDPLVFGPFTTDPKCIYDNGHFIVSMLELDQDSATGDLTGNTYEYLAVSESNDPSSTTWDIYRFDVTNDGGNCPCLGDQPLIGADANGVYISTNSFPVFENGFNGAQLYAISKTQLESGASSIDVVNVPVVAPSGFGADNLPYSLQPAKTAPGSTDAPNTEYFLSSLDFAGTADNRIALWTLTGTNTLGTATPDLSLTGNVLQSEVYATPPAAQQSSAGLFPLRDDLYYGTGNPQYLLYGIQFDRAKYHTELLNTNDDRMNEVVYAGGKLYGALNSGVKTPNGPSVTGIAWFVVDPSTATVTNNGYLAVNNESLMFPAFGVNSSGKGAMGVTIVGTDMHPSTAYAIFDGQSFGPLHISYAGPVGDDGFTGYEALLPNAANPKRPGNQTGVARWGDYGAAAVAPDGSIWLANETTSTTRTVLANWGTYITHVQP